MAHLLKIQTLSLNRPILGGVSHLPDRSSSTSNTVLLGPARSSATRNGFLLSTRQSGKRALRRLNFPEGTRRQIVCELRAASDEALAKELQKKPEARSPFATTTSSSDVGLPDLTSLVADPDFLLAASSMPNRDQPKVNLPPRICTLRAFGKSGEGLITTEPDETVSAFFKSLAASIEFSAKIQDWEILSGRLAMMVFASAVLLEALTGNSVFQKLDTQRLLEFVAAAIISVVGAAGFALAWRAKSRVAYTMSRGYENLVNALIDNVVDGLFFDDEP